jgi:signal peptidase II
MGRHNWQWLFWLVALGVFILDWYTKELVATQLSVGEEVRLTAVCRIYHLPQVNRGAFLALGDRWGERANWFFMAVTGIVAGLLLFLHTRPGVKANPWLSAGMGLIVGGATGNFLDRLRFGGVRDFVQLFLPINGNDFIPVTAIFNLADSAVIAGAGLLLVASWWGQTETPTSSLAGSEQSPAQV